MGTEKTFPFVGHGDHQQTRRGDPDALRSYIENPARIVISTTRLR